MEGVVFDSIQNLKIKSRLRIPAEAHKGYNHVVQQIKKVVDMMAEEAGYYRHFVKREFGKNIDSQDWGKMKEKEIEKLLKSTLSPTYDEIIGIIESFGDGWVKLDPRAETL